MKKILHIIILLSASFVLMQSCQKEVMQTEIIKEVTIDTTITAGSDFLLNLAPYGDEGNVATLLEKGNNFSISQLENETDMFTTVYHYKAAEKSQGTDQVTLSISKTANGRKCDKDSTIVYINFTIK